MTRVFLFPLIFACLAFGQQQQQTPPPATPPPATANPTPSRPSTPRTPNIPTQPTQPNTRMPQDNDPMSQRGGVSGRIIPTPATRVRVDLYLDSVRMDTTFSESDGTFRFGRAMGRQRYQVHIDVGPGVEYVEEIDFSMPFPAMVHIRPQGIRRTDGRPQAAGGATIISLASLNVPKNAAKEFEKGRELAQKHKLDEALQRLQKATDLYPKYAEAFSAIGKIRREQNQPQEAQKAFEQAIAADPAWVQSYVDLASLQLAANRMPELLETSDKILKLDPSLGFGHFFNSVARFSSGDLDEAEKSGLRATQAERGRVPQARLLLARIYQRKGDAAQYAQQLRSFLKENPGAQNADKLRAELAQAEKSSATAIPPK